MSWYDSPFTGLFAELGPVRPRAHDPDVAVCAGRLVPDAHVAAMDVGGAALTAAAAEGAAVGEAVERIGAARAPADARRVTSFRAFGAGAAVDPARFVLFDAAQHARAGFPYAPFTADTACGWVAFRRLADGRAVWVPEVFAYLACDGDDALAPRLSTGLAAGRRGDPVLLRAVQEVVERDACAGGWWGAYPLEEHDPERVFRELGEPARRFRRPNLAWRMYRVDTPYAAHVTWVSCRGEDHEGDCFSIGSACRETRRASWLKSLLEAVQGRHWVRHLLATQAVDPAAPPISFAAHAAHYSLHPERLARTPLARARPADADDGTVEDLGALARRLGDERPVLFRAMTPADLPGDWYALRAVVPGLQPLEGDHRLPHLGGSLWGGRPLAESAALPPHPFA